MTNHPPRGTTPNRDEIHMMRAKFPSLRDNEWTKTSNFVEDDNPIRYNCVAWSLCRSELGWIGSMIDECGNNNGVVDVEDFDAFYQICKYEICGTSIQDCVYEKNKRKIALFWKDGGHWHVAKAVDSGWWESKLGENIRIMHRLEQMMGGKYGDICRCYCKNEPKAGQNQGEN